MNAEERSLSMASEQPLETLPWILRGQRRCVLLLKSCQSREGQAAGGCTCVSELKARLSMEVVRFMRVFRGGNEAGSMGWLPSA